VALTMMITEIAETWASYLTMAEELKLAAQTLTRDISKLSSAGSPSRMQPWVFAALFASSSGRHRRAVSNGRVSPP
jgi:predicted DNA-binding transcriptional regulator YafY